MQLDRRADGPITAINVTPLVDILMVLLIIFMATAPVIQRRAMKVEVPKAAHHERVATEAVRVIMNAKREIFLSDKRVSERELAARLAAAEAAQPDLPVTLAADKTIPYGDIMTVLDGLRGAGVRKIGLEVRSR